MNRSNLSFPHRLNLTKDEIMCCYLGDDVMCKISLDKDYHNVFLFFKISLSEFHEQTSSRTGTLSRRTELMK